jgi:hypothetical protein
MNDEERKPYRPPHVRRKEPIGELVEIMKKVTLGSDKDAGDEIQSLNMKPKRKERNSGSLESKHQQKSRLD